MKDYLKKAVMALLVMTMIVMFFPNGKIRVQAEEKYSGKWRYTISSGEATLKEYFGTASSIIIPSFIDGYPVTEIGEKLFEDSSITNVTIPKSIEKIGYNAFANCKYLTSIYFDAKDCNVYYFRDMMYMNVFLNAGKFSDSLKVTFGPNVEKVPKGMFEARESEYAHVTEIVLSDSIKNIGDWAFANCYDLQNVTWGKNIERIESEAFRNCTKLQSITIPEGTEYIGLNAFKGCKYLKQINFNEKKCKAFMMRSSMDEHVFVDAGKYSSSLKVIFGNKVEVVPASLFEAPESAYAHITEVIIPKNVKEIGAFAFNNCKDLKKITIKGATIVPNSELYNPFNGCSKSLVFECDKGKNAENYAKKYHFKILYLKSGNKPQNLIGSITGKKIILRWDKVNAINGFEVYCKVGNGKYKKIADTSKNSYTYKKLSKKKTCYFKVRSYVMNNGAKEYSSFSDVVKARAW